MNRAISSAVAITITIGLSLILVGVILLFQYYWPSQNEIKITVPKRIELTVWPDKNSFDLENKTFEAEDLNTRETVKIATNASTKYYRRTMRAEGYIHDNYDFNGFYALLKDWEGPSWRFTLKGEKQNDGTVLASEIFYQVQ